MNASVIPAMAPDRCDGIRLHGFYRASPFRGEPCAAGAQGIDLLHREEYERLGSLESAGSAPVLLSVAQRYRLLESIVHALRERLSRPHCMLVRVGGPDFNTPVPDRLLDEDVFLVNEPFEAIEPILGPQARDIVVIDHDLRADGLEPGSNWLSISVLRPTCPAHALRELSDWGQSHPLGIALDGLHIEYRRRTTSP